MRPVSADRLDDTGNGTDVALKSKNLRAASKYNAWAAAAEMRVFKDVAAAYLQALLQADGQVNGQIGPSDEGAYCSCEDRTKPRALTTAFHQMVNQAQPRLKNCATHCRLVSVLKPEGR